MHFKIVEKKLDTEVLVGIQKVFLRAWASLDFYKLFRFFSFFHLLSFFCCKIMMAELISEQSDSSETRMVILFLHEATFVDSMSCAFAALSSLHRLKAPGPRARAEGLRRVAEHFQTTHAASNQSFSLRISVGVGAKLGAT
jgi:hypothetical protein